jgi:single-strand DNA-binding protein
VRHFTIHEQGYSMASLNRVFLIGNLGADPTVEYLPSGDPIAKFRLATTERVSDGQGGHALVTNWHRVSVVGRQAEVAGRYLKKGSQVFVEGKLRSESWTDREGVVRKTWTVLAYRMQMLGKPVSPEGDGSALAGEQMAWMDGTPYDASAIVRNPRSQGGHAGARPE